MALPAPALLSNRVAENLPRTLQYGARMICRRISLILLLFAASPALLSGQTIAKRALITQPVEEKNLTVLRGNTYPLALAKYDQGAAPASLPMQRMLLVLKRSPELETALDSLLDQQQDKASPNYHAWLTPEQFGQQFGPADADIQAVTSWLQLQGFQVAKVSNGRTVIEFSGTASQVQSAFHTEIHKFSVKNEDHWANASDPQIPTALVPAVAGVLTLHNFPRHAMNHVVGTFKRSKDSSALTPVNPLFTLPNYFMNLTYYGVGPYDFATIYNVTPLWTASPAIDGTGQTIAIVGETDIDIQDIRSFRSLFGLAPKDPVFIIDGPDPGVQGDEIESDLDLEWSGAIAPNATIKFVVAATTDTTLGVDLSAQYIVDHNLAPIVSESYGICEAALGTAGNQFFNQLWQQAAAQGMSVFLSSGDSGSAGCDRNEPAQFGLQVSGFASTPYTVAVGGTDFNDLSNPTTYFNPTNDAHQASAKSYIPEMTWNDSCTNAEWSIETGSSVAETNCNNPNLSFAVAATGGSGGKSTCTIGDGQDVVSCSGGYPKPLWQTGTGVPNDTKRDIPDVSLLASDGFNGSFYMMCDKDITDGDYCDPGNPNGTVIGVGGTSASAPSFAGIMALILQKTQARQGNPNYVLYKLAAQQPASGCNSSTSPASTCVFYDVTNGTIAMPCFTKSTPDCLTNVKSDQFGVLTGYPTTAGYDLATGLGTVNAANLVNAWTTAVTGSKGSATTLTMTPTPLTITHGATANVNVTVAPSPAGAATPSGEVALMTSTGLGVASFLLTNGTVAGTTGALPGGTYTVTAHYPGDATFAASDSTPAIHVTVSPEPSTTTVKILTADANGNPIPFTTGPYGGFVYVRADVAGQSGNGIATGNVTIKDNGTAIAGNPFALNEGGNTATPNGIFTFGAGTHAITALYSGDASFTAAPVASANFTITQAATGTTLPGGSQTVGVGGPVVLTAQITATSCGDPPTGKVNFINQGKVVDSEVVAPTSTQQCNVTVTASGMFALNTPGISNITAQYVGDTNYSSSTSAPFSFDAVFGTTITVTPSTPTIQQGASAVMTATISPSPTQAGQPPITGTVQFSNQSAGVNQGSPVAVTNGQAQITISSLPAGQFRIGATYSGDTDYAGSFGVGGVTVNPGPDFSVAANPATITIARPGQSGSTMLTLVAMNGLTGTFNLTPQCAGIPLESTCSVSPTSVTFSSTVTTASVMLTVATTAPSSVAPSRRWSPTGTGTGIVIAFGLLALVLMLGFLRERRGFQFALGVITLAVLLTIAACGGGSGGGGGGGGNAGTPVGLYPNAQISFTLGSTSHTVSLSINVQ